MITIQNLTPIEKAYDKFTAEFDDGTKLKVTAVQVADFSLYKGRELEEEEYAELRVSIELSSAKARAMRILGSRNMSAKNVHKRLIEKGESAETASATVEWLEKSGFINDAEYADMIVRHYLGKGYGIARIKDEFYKRGIGRELWEDAMCALEGTEDAAYNVLKKKLRGASDKESIRKTTAMLYRRGFTGSEVRGAVSRYLENVGEDGIWQEESG